MVWTNDDPFDTPFLLEDGSPYIHTQSTVSAAIKVAKFAKHFQSRQSIEVKKTGVYILATFLESFPCAIVQNQVILPPKMAKRYRCAAFDQANIIFL